MSSSGFGRAVPAGATGFRLVRAAAAGEFAQASAFRAHIFEQRRSVRFDEALEARRDREGHVFLLFSADELVATGRALPFPSNLSPLSRIAPDFDASGADSEIGRIAALRSPAAARYSQLLLTLGVGWLLQHTRFRNYLAYCHPALVSVYRALGAEDSGYECHVPGRGDAHRILRGSYEDALRLGQALHQRVLEGVPESANRFLGFPSERGGLPALELAV